MMSMRPVLLLAVSVGIVTSLVSPAVVHTGAAPVIQRASPIHALSEVIHPIRSKYQIARSESASSVCAEARQTTHRAAK